jgi:hypothetical protein
MAKKEEPIADSDTGKIKVKAKEEKQPTNNETKGNVTTVKEKMKMKPQVMEETITKINLDSPVENTEVEQVVEQVVDQPLQVVESQTETPVIEEVIKGTEEVVANTEEFVEQALAENAESGQPLPESINKLLDFMEDTGGDLNDYIALNQDYSKFDNQDLLREYYRSTKPHLTHEEIDFVMDDEFAYDEDMDEERDIKRKKLAMKEQVAQAKLHLESVKTKYYEDIKAGSKLTNEQKEAIEFSNKTKEESERDYETRKRQHEIFKTKTNNVFNNQFKGFEYNIGEKTFRFNVKDTVKLKETQGDINNFIRKFLTKDNTIDDAQGYHKGLFTAMNPDQVATHFYEQGKADALKESIAKSKNVSMDPRQSYDENANTSGFKVRALDLGNESDFKFKIKNKNK